MDVYNYHCEELNENPLLQSHLSTAYGVTHNSILNHTQYFHVTEGLVPDIMHIILEGSLELCMRHLLMLLIREEKLFTLDALNNRITSFKYGISEINNIPTEISPINITNEGHLKQSG